MPTYGEIGVMLSVLLPAIIYLLGRILEKNKFDKENKKIDADAEATKASARKIESEVAQNIVESANALVSEYKEMLEALSKKYATLDERLQATESRLDDEIKRRIRGEKLTIELFHGFNEVLKQLKELNITPAWKPDGKLNAALEKMQEEKCSDSE